MEQKTSLAALLSDALVQNSILFFSLCGYCLPIVQTLLFQRWPIIFDDYRLELLDFFCLSLNITSFVQC